MDTKEHLRGSMLVVGSTKLVLRKAYDWNSKRVKAVKNIKTKSIIQTKQMYINLVVSGESDLFTLYKVAEADIL